MHAHYTYMWSNRAHSYVHAHIHGDRHMSPCASSDVTLSFDHGVTEGLKCPCPSTLGREKKQILNSKGNTGIFLWSPLLSADSCYSHTQGFFFLSLPQALSLLPFLSSLGSICRQALHLLNCPGIKMKSTEGWHVWVIAALCWPQETNITLPKALPLGRS